MPRLFKEFQRLEEMESAGQNSVEEYIKNHHGIKMKGVEKIFKYELTDGDRMLYAHSTDLPWLSRHVENSIVLLRYSKHDYQGSVAKSFDLKKERGYQYIREVIEKMTELDIDAVNNSDISIEDYIALADILNSDDYTEWHKVYVIKDDQDYSTLTLDEMEIYLSGEQGDCIAEYFSNPCPTLIIGGAGTGKTLIAVHLLIDYAKNNRKKKAFYFTQSPELRKKVIALYKQYGEELETDNVEFQDINEYCIKLLGLKHSSIVDTRQFLKYVENTPGVLEVCQNNGLTPMIVWSEIRGIIKGGMSSEWTRAEAMPQGQFSGSIKSLIDKGYFVRSEDDKKRIRLANNSTAETQAKMDCDEELSAAEKENLNLAIEYFSGFDPSIRFLSEREYMNVSDEFSSVEKEKRTAVWDICRKYDDYLIRNSLYDENDLVRMMFEKGFCKEQECTFSVVDEVQDYTELQLFLIKTITGGKQIVFAGDEHQNINPASFSESRMKSLFFLRDNAELKIRRLHKNFRCQQEIINITNALAAVRRKAIGSGSAENEEPEVSIRKTDAIPNRLVFSEDNLDSCICELMPYPKAVFLVPDQATKENLIERIDKLSDTIIKRIGTEKFDARRESAVFTVADIKGVEYEYVVCYDLIGNNIDTWQRILAGVHHQTKYRYYFNLLYVAMTRAQEYLCLVDTHLSEELEKKFGIQTVNVFDSKKLYFDRLSSSETDYYEQAHELEQNGKYREAIGLYRAAKAEQACIDRCSYHISIEDKDYDAAAVYAIALDSPEMIDGYWDDIKKHDLKQLAEAYYCLKTNPGNYEFRQINISMLIQKVIPDEYKTAIQRVILQALRYALHEMNTTHKKTDQDLPSRKSGDSGESRSDKSAPEKSVQALIEQADLLKNNKEWENAIMLLIKAGNENPDEHQKGVIVSSIVRCYIEMGDVEQANNYFADACNKYGRDVVDVETLTLFASLLEYRKDYVTAEKYAIEAYNLSKGNPSQALTSIIGRLRKDETPVPKVSGLFKQSAVTKMPDWESTYVKYSTENNSKKKQPGIRPESKTATSKKKNKPQKMTIDERRQQLETPVEEEIKRSCKNCKLYIKEDCAGLNGLCSDYEYAPVISEEERKAWPAEMKGPYGKGYGRNRRR